MGGLALRILFCGTDRECGAIREVAAGVDLVTFSGSGTPTHILRTAGAPERAVEAVIVSEAWLLSNGPGAVSLLLKADDALCVLVETRDR